MGRNVCVVFGGTGFIGSHLANLILSKGICDKVILVDIKSIDEDRFGYFLNDLISKDKIEFIHCDVREKISLNLVENIELIVNLAAVHREPGHEVEEYFETNLKGAEHVCAWAEEVACEQIIFTSSIAPYGPSEKTKSEETIPCPETAYGSSKFAAEKIHQCWFNKDVEKRKLVIVRPGVVFGPGEGGNVTRLVRAVLGRYFFYMGNQGTVKAGIYVKELTETMLWALKRLKDKQNFILYNATMDPAPTVSEYVDSICKVANAKRTVLSVPYGLLILFTSIIDVITKPFGIKHPFSPVRIRKLVRSNKIEPQCLKNKRYNYKYDLKSALKDWKVDKKQDWN